jgi:hypothetical protein
MHPNLKILLLAALVPLILGFIWYNPKVFGSGWKKAADMTDEKIKGGNMILRFGLTYLFSFFAAFAIQFVVIHQFGFTSILANEPGIKDPNSEISLFIKNFLEKYGHNFRTFKHGALHGTLAGITLILPVIAINAMFERKGFKYVIINAGFWIVNLAIMGGIICQFS